MPLVTFDDRNVTDIYNTYEINDTSTSTNNTAQTRTYSVTGNGIISVSLSVFTDATSNTGSVYQYIARNTVVLARGFNRISSAFAGQQGGNCCITMKVSNGDVLELYNLSNKNGTKTYYWNLLCIGCTVTQTS